MNPNTAAFQYGMMIACVSHDRPVKSASVMSSAIIDHPEVDRWLFRIGEVAYRESGLMGSLGYQICKRAASAPVIGGNLRVMASIVGRAIGRAVLEQKRAAAEDDATLDAGQIKSATALWLKSLVNGGAAMAPEAGKILLGGALATGAVAGGLGWAANRGIKTDEEDIEAMKAKIHTYRRITKDINDELSLRASTV